MAENSKIEWTTHTFNPWIGCTDVSPACKFCYARDLSRRYGWADWERESRASVLRLRTGGSLFHGIAPREHQATARLFSVHLWQMYSIMRSNRSGGRTYSR